MIVTSVEAITKAKSRVSIDGQFAFVLYKGELSRFHVKEGKEIEESLYQQIRKEVILKRAKLRAMHLLNQMDRTESQLRTKLLQGEYPADIVEEAIQYVKSFGYINDENYIRRFVEQKKEKKSKKEIQYLLFQKGLDRDLVTEVMDQMFEDEDSSHAIRSILQKKRFCVEEATDKERQKMCAYLIRKGFSYQDVITILDKY